MLGYWLGHGKGVPRSYAPLLLIYLNKITENDPLWLKSNSSLKSINYVFNITGVGSFTFLELINLMARQLSCCFIFIIVFIKFTKLKENQFFIFLKPIPHRHINGRKNSTT